jgi:hypothetical protein
MSAPSKLLRLHGALLMSCSAMAVGTKAVRRVVKTVRELDRYLSIRPRAAPAQPRSAGIVRLELPRRGGPVDAVDDRVRREQRSRL